MDKKNHYSLIDWPVDRLVPAFQTPEHLEIYDIRGTHQDVQILLASLAGIVNRPQPHLYLISHHDDPGWLSEIQDIIPYDIREARYETTQEKVIEAYRDHIEGVVIYDPEFIDSINVATTIAGQQNALIASPGLADKLRSDPYNFSVLFDLRAYHWKSRAEAYAWAREHFLDQSSARVVAGMNPSISVGLRPFLIATGAFVYWLDSRDIFPYQRKPGSERVLLQEILQRYPPRAVHMGWFINEGSGVTLCSEAAIPVLASDYFTNLEVWTALQSGVQTTSTRNTKVESTEPEAEDGKIYVSFTMSDGDNLQYTQHRMRQLWHDPARGTVPIGWTIAPALSQAAPSIAAYYQKSASDQDEMIAGPSGAGYIFPSRWPTEHLPWFLDLTGRLMKEMDLSVLEVLDTDTLHSRGLNLLSAVLGGDMGFTATIIQQRYLQTLKSYGLKGLLSGAGRWQSKMIINDGIPLYRNLGLVGSRTQALRVIRRAARMQRRRPLYLNVYVLAWNMGPGEIRQVADELETDERYHIVKPSLLMEFIKIS